jgi:hypothetical protein
MTHSLPLSTYSALGGLRQGPRRAAESPAEAGICGTGSREVRVLLSTWGSRGDAEPLAGLAMGLRELGADVRVCAPPDEGFVALPARVGVPLVPLGPSVRSVVTGESPPSAATAFWLAPELVAARYETLTAAAEGCDALPATGLMPADARSAAEKLGLRHVFTCFHPFGDCRPGRRAPGGRTPDRGPAVLGRPGRRVGYRRGPRRSGSDLRVPVGRAQDGSGPETRARARPWPPRSAPTGRRGPRSFSST